MDLPNRFIAKQIMPQLTKVFDTTTQITDYLKEVGLSYRRQNMLDDIRQYRGSQARAASWEIFDPWRNIEEGSMIDTHLKNRPEYRAIGDVLWQDAETGAISTYRSSFYVDAITNPQELADQIEEQWAREEKYAGKQFAGFQIADVWHNLTPR